jgi:hypothetical protein
LSTITGGSRWYSTHLIGSSPEDSDGLKGQSLKRQGLSGCQPGEKRVDIDVKRCEEYVKNM